MSSKSRIEQILRYGLGEETTLPPNLSRVEGLLVELIESGGGSSINIDASLSNVSTNPVQNKAIKEKFDILDGNGEGSIRQKITFAIAEIIADAPEDFDTLKEISDWIASHEDSAAAMNSAIQVNAAAIDTKVDKVTGKGLSTEDYTTAEKTKLDGLSNYDDTQVYQAINSLSSSIGALGQTVEGKVDKITGKGLSTEDYSTAEKTKLAGLSNYDDTALTSRVSVLETTVGDINSVLEEAL